ncbi:MAG: family 20 glycosylhydrolase [Bacteroidales bacterium]|nr:family 20 glycosylhydrolase [Bacteroidales bacterium]
MKSLLSLVMLSVCLQQVSALHSLIPIPVKYEPTEEVFTLDARKPPEIIYREEMLKQYAYQLQDLFLKAGVAASVNRVAADPEHGCILMMLYEADHPDLGQEGYTLEVMTDSIILKANEPTGIFNGLQTLRQLFPAGFEGRNPAEAIAVPVEGCRIVDYPRFAWRGLMLDVSRHFFTVDEVKAYIDQMARYKFNIFHWHLTDDEGWRIEIKSLPKLTEVGAWRVERYGRFGSDRPYPEPGEEATYGGFYTQDQIREIVRYAALRNITIVPEIDMPGHCMAALAAYPELSTGKEKKFVNPGSKFSEWYGGGRFKMLIENTLNPADEKVYEFVDKVFTEVAELFPGNWIHMGGDECYKGYWEADSGVQQFMKEQGLKDSHELQSYFVKRVEEIISSKGKKMIGWDEILEGGLAEGAAVMSWRGMRGGIEAAGMGHEVVMAPTTFAYLDYTQGDHSVENPIYADLRLEKVYEFEPVPVGVDPGFILGGQGNLWTEAIPDLQFAFYMAYPRAFALAETLWSPAGEKEWNHFMTRTEDHFKRFDAGHINICKAVYEPKVTVRNVNQKLVCTLENPVPGTEMYYTINNTYPVIFGTKYTGPFEIPPGDLSLRTRTYRDGEPLGRELMIHRSELERRANR